MLELAQRMNGVKHRLRRGRPPRGLAQVHPETEELVGLVARDEPLEVIDQWLWSLVVEHIDEELDLLASAVFAMNLEPQSMDDVRAALSKGMSEEALRLFARRVRHRIAKFIRDRERGEDDPNDTD